MITGIIFDMDGVIIDSEDTHKDIELTLLQEHGVDIPREEFIKHTGRPLREIVATINEERGADLDVDAFIEERKERYRNRVGDVAVIEGQDDLIRDLSTEHPVAVATSEVRDIAEEVLEQKGIRPHIRALVTSTDIIHGKPDPEIFQTAAAELGVDPGSTAVIEDSHNGITAANAGGFISIGFQSNDDLDLSAADHVVHTSDELRELLTALGED